jgi:hypothetical protein
MIIKTFRYHREGITFLTSCMGWQTVLSQAWLPLGVWFSLVVALA